MAAVDLAMRSPSVCNRQTARIHVFTGEDAQRALSFQSGNRGFGHRIPMVIIVTSDLRYFTGTAERYQGWIDGGMFSMLLLLALHAQGLGAVSLNWSVNNERDRELRNAVAIPEYERVIMLIGCGFPSPDGLVPVSSRRLATDVASWGK
jgi:nitroreductase